MLGTAISNDTTRIYLGITTILYTSIALFFLPYESVNHARIFLPFITLQTLMFGGFTSNNHYRLDFVLMLLLIGVAAIDRSIIKYTETAVAVSICLILQQKPRIPCRLSCALLVMTFVSIVGQMIIYNYPGPPPRPALSIIDPNFSGMLTLLFVYWASAERQYFFAAFGIIAGLFFVSRNFVISVLLFLFLQMLNKTFAKKIFRRMPLLTVVYITSALVLIGSSFWLKYFIPSINYDPNFSRVFSFNDASNFQRFLANNLLLEGFLSDFSRSFLFGWTENYGPHWFVGAGNEIHNSFLAPIARNGLIWSSIYFALICRIIKKSWSHDFAPYFLSFLFFGSFLHSAWQGAQLLFFLQIAVIVEQRSRSRNQLI